MERWRPSEAKCPRCRARLYLRRTEILTTLEFLARCPECGWEGVLKSLYCGGCKKYSYFVWEDGKWRCLECGHTRWAGPPSLEALEYLRGRREKPEFKKREGLPEFLKGFRPDMTLGELTEAIQRTVEGMDCKELYRAVDEARIVRGSIFDPTTHLILTGFIHHGSRRLKDKCPSYFRRLTEKYRA